MCEYCENDGYYKRNKSLISKTLKNNVDIDLAINVKDKKLVASIENLTMNVEDNNWFLPTKKINYCPMCRKEAGRVKHILDYGLELENVKENELPDKDNEIIIQFNNILSEKYGLFEVDVLENDNLYFRGRITSSTKSENNAKLKLLIAELNEFYNKYNLKKVIKSMIAYGHTI